MTVTFRKKGTLAKIFENARLCSEMLGGAFWGWKNDGIGLICRSWRPSHTPPPIRENN